MDKIENLINSVSNSKYVEIDDIPNIDLYMDQVVQLFDNKLKEFKRNDEEKILTKTMINNYVKGKLLMPVNKKKYSKEHILLISLIYELKGLLSIGDIQKLLEPIVDDISNDKDQYDLENIYTKIDYFREIESNKFKCELNNLLESINELNETNNYEKKFILMNILASKANMYRRLSEKMIDEFFGEITDK